MVASDQRYIAPDSKIQSVTVQNEWHGSAMLCRVVTYATGATYHWVWQPLVADDTRRPGRILMNGYLVHRGMPEHSAISAAIKSYLDREKVENGN